MPLTASSPAQHAMARFPYFARYVFFTDRQNLSRLPELCARSAKQFHGLDVGTGPLPDKSILRRRAAVRPSTDTGLGATSSAASKGTTVTRAVFLPGR
ncbi:hypothetical protein M0D64_42270 [Paraburkholderia sp. WS6]|uniref:Uncharacterized protein n=1 Tax=Paraburkholderia madseniana TaxID=2599607 RepID=A0AAP5BNA2_9BURK|nr:hypothetical protein [Paraburkholderia sp. WS6]MDQ6413757.1 hypothetical protein [Paraburkholderia madseniana]